jgi:hypothetical protein
MVAASLAFDLLTTPHGFIIKSFNVNRLASKRVQNDTLDTLKNAFSRSKRQFYHFPRHGSRKKYLLIFKLAIAKYMKNWFLTNYFEWNRLCWLNLKRTG